MLVNIFLLLTFAHTIKGLADLGAPDFACSNMAPSGSVPTSVHRVRPADIRVVAAMGDSLTAGADAGTSDGSQLYLDHRGQVYSIGIDRGLDQHITIPNILAKYNPQLKGAASGVGDVKNRKVAGLNVAISGQKSEHLIGQARDLIAKIEANPEPIHEPQQYAANFDAAIAILQQSLPRTIVSIVSMINDDVWNKVYREACRNGGYATNVCPSQNITDAAATVRNYQQAVMDIQNSGKFEKDDFTVVVQPFFVNIHDPPRYISYHEVGSATILCQFQSNDTVDMKFFSLDCFHFSTYGNALIAKMLWNNMLQPVGGKTTNYNLSNDTFSLLCPDTVVFVEGGLFQECPYIRTVNNSLACKWMYDDDPLRSNKSIWLCFFIVFHLGVGLFICSRFADCRRKYAQQFRNTLNGVILSAAERTPFTNPRSHYV